MTSADAGSRPALVVLVAPAGPLAGVLDALTDWSALGLVLPFVWLQPGESPGAPETASLVDGGRTRPVVLEQVLAAGRHGRIRICILVPAVPGCAALPGAVEDDMAGRIGASAGRAVVERLRCTVYRPGPGLRHGHPAREGWHNLVISPEDALGPGMGHRVLPPTSDAIDLGASAAAVLSALAGLWVGIDGAPLDGREPLPAQTVRVVRAFYRRLDTTATEQHVRRRVLTVSQELPRPRTAGRRAEYIPDVGRAATELARGFWDRHSGVWFSGREEVPTTEAESIGWLQTLRMFGGFLLASLRNAPSRWYQTLRHRYSEQIAARVQRGVFGEARARYAVVVNGVRGDGGSVGWQALDRASSELDETMSRGGLVRQSASVDLGEVWRDFAGTALTLADGGDDTRPTRPVEVELDPGVARRPEQVAPGRAAAFEDAPGHLRSSGESQGVRPYDVLAVDELRQRLAQAGDRAGDPLERGRLAAALQHWHDRHQDAFTVQVGRRLAGAVQSRAAEVQSLLGALEPASPDDEDGELARKQERLALVLRVLLGLLLAVLAVLVVLGVRDTIEATTALVGGLVAALTWAGSSFAVFATQQRNLFAKLNEATLSASQAEVNQRNLGQAVLDLRRTSQAYGQFLEWSRVLSVVIAQPYGESSDERAPTELVTEGMPLCAAVGAAAPQEERIDEVVRQARADQFTLGWLGRPWAALLEEAPARLRETGDPIEPSRLYAEPSGPDHLLSRWADLVEKHGTGSGPRTAAWEEVRRRLRNSTVDEALVEQVRTADGTVTSFEDFIVGIGQVQEGRPQAFALEVFGADASVSGRAAVTEDWPGPPSDQGWDRIVCTVQLSEGIPLWDLSWSPARLSEPIHEDEDDLPAEWKGRAL